MILSAGMRTDIPNYYGDWFIERIREGFVYARNPLFPNKVIRYELSPAKVDAIAFCSKNYAPFLRHIAALRGKFRLYCQYTITGYGKDVEPNVPLPDESVKTLLALEKIVGKQRIAWRFDPVLITPAHPLEERIESFRKLCSALRGHVDRCIFSFVTVYAKLQSNMPELLSLTPADKQRLAEELGSIAASYGIPLQTCAAGENYGNRIASSGCLTLDVIGKANGCLFKEVKHLGNRRGCKCIQSRDVGWYDSCPNGCRYCYANRSAALVQENFARHDVHSPLLIGTLREEDELIEGNQLSFLKKDENQLSLFDL